MNNKRKKISGGYIKNDSTSFPFNNKTNDLCAPQPGQSIPKFSTKKQEN
jgi:hypothetical protein